MNEKYKQYYNTPNDKELIARKVPTERDLEKFEEWKVSKRERLKNQSLLTPIVFLTIVLVRNWFGQFIRNNIDFNWCINYI